MKLKRHLIELTLSLVLFSSSTTAWPGAGAGKRGGAAQLSEIEVRGVGGASEVQSLLADMEAEAALRTRDSVTPPPSNPSCFFLALSALPSSSPCEALSRSDSARIEIAASMAICEVKTAGHGEGKVPRECSDWKKGKSKVGSCVEALARSPQHWSSYSGYLREVVTLCSSYRRWADLENARDLHASTAATFAAFVEQLKGVEKARARREAEELLERVANSEELGALQAALSSLGAGLLHTHQQQVSDLSELEQSLNITSVAFQGLLSTLRLEITRAAEEAAARSRKHSDELGGALQTVRSQHADSLEATSLSFRNDLAEAVATLQGAASGLLTELGNVKAQLGGVESDLRAANHEISSALASSKALSKALIANVDLAARFQSKQMEDSRLHQQQAQELSLVLLNLTKRMEEHDLSPSLSSLFGLQDAYSISSWVSSIARDGGGGLLLVLAAFAVLVTSSQTVSRVLTLASTLAALYPFLVSALALFRLSKGLWRPKSSFTNLPRFPSALQPSNRSTEALVSTHFALAYPPTSSKAGIGSPGRRSRASIESVSSLYGGERGLLRIGRDSKSGERLC